MQHSQFDQEFFPTSRAVAHKMLAAITNKDARYFLEPSAGKGDLAHVIKPPTDDRNRYGHRLEVDCIERSPELCSILRDKGYPVIGYDWLDFDGVCYYDAILMNPPFSNGDEHLLKAWDFMHNGEIVCLLNQETIDNPRTERRARLVKIINDHGRVEPLGDMFRQAERRTPVNVAMVYLKKIAVDDTIDMWARETAEREPDEPGADPNYLAIRDTLGNMQHYYDAANKHMLDAFHHIRMASLYMRANEIGKTHGANEQKDMDMGEIMKLALGNTNSARAEYTRLHRRAAWRQVFAKTEFHKWLDKKQAEEFIRSIDRDSNIPFTKENIKGTLQNVFLQRNRLFEHSVVNVFDELTRFFAGNTSGGGSGGAHYSGWKTNADYMVNEKLVFPYGCKYDADMASFKYWYSQSSVDIYNDLDRVLCVLDGRKFEECGTIGSALNIAFNRLDTMRGPYGMRGSRANWSSSDQVAESQFFEIRFFKKGTVHLKFKDRELWERFNQKASAGKNWLGRDSRESAA